MMQDAAMKMNIKLYDRRIISSEYSPIFIKLIDYETSSSSKMKGSVILEN